VCVDGDDDGDDDDDGGGGGGGTGRFDFEQRWPLDGAMVLGAWLGLLLGNCAARYLTDANSLHWPMTFFLSYAAVMVSQSVSTAAAACSACLYIYAVQL
jgi:hypothetical protein